MSIALLSVVVSGLAGFPLPWSGPPAVVDFDAELAALWHGPACVGQAVLGADVKPTPIDDHCTKLRAITSEWHDTWWTVARPFFKDLVPADVPPTVVYPFGGADLLTALTVYPEATTLTIIALEPGGDPRTFTGLNGPGLPRALELIRRHFKFLLHLDYSRTVDLDELSRGLLAGVLIYDLEALAILGYEPLGLRYFTLGPTGGRRYLGPDDLVRIDAEALKKTGLARTKYVSGAFGNFELRFRRRPTAEEPSPPEQVFRHISHDLENPGFAKDPGLKAYLDLQGDVAAMTKASSYLLWWTSFSDIRDWLVGHLVWMVSDSTGLSPDVFDPQKLEQIPYGRFDAPIISCPRGRAKLIEQVWKDHPERPMPFNFGYPSNAGDDNLLVTRRKP